MKNIPDYEFEFASQTGKIQDILDFTRLIITDLDPDCQRSYKSNKTLSNGQFCRVINPRSGYNRGTIFTYDSNDKKFRSSQILPKPPSAQSLGLQTMTLYSKFENSKSGFGMSTNSKMSMGFIILAILLLCFFLYKKKYVSKFGKSKFGLSKLKSTLKSLTK